MEGPPWEQVVRLRVSSQGGSARSRNSNNRAAVVARAPHQRRDETIGRDQFGLLRSCSAFPSKHSGVRS